MIVLPEVIALYVIPVVVFLIIAYQKNMQISAQQSSHILIKLIKKPEVLSHSRIN